MLPVKYNPPSPVFVRLPVPVMLPDTVRLWPDPSDAVFEPVRVNAFPMVSVIAPPAVVAEVMIVPSESASVDPLSVKAVVLPAEPSFVNDIVPSVIVPMLFVFVVCVVPPKTRFHDPDVVGNVLQFEAVDQLPLPPPPDHVATPIGAATPRSTHAHATITVANIHAVLRRIWDICGSCYLSLQREIEKLIVTVVRIFPKQPQGSNRRKGSSQRIMKARAEFLFDTPSLVGLLPHCTTLALTRF